MNEYSHDTAYTVTDMKQPISTVSRTSGFESLAGFEKQDKVRIGPPSPDLASHDSSSEESKASVLAIRIH